MRYARNVVKTTLLSRAQDLGILYDRKYDVMPRGKLNPLYQPKLDFESPHTLALERVPARSKVLDVGCASGYMARALREKGCEVTGVDQYPPPDPVVLDKFVQANLGASELPVNVGEFDYVLLLDVIEHLCSPELFVDSLRQLGRSGAEPTVIASTGNIAFLATRLMLCFGQFHYGPRGILDLTHTRLFTFASLRNLFEQAGFQVEEVRGVPAPFRLALGKSRLASLLLRMNQAAIRVWRSLFSYQIFMVVRPLPSLEFLLGRAVESSRARMRGDMVR
jgi:2-polyprenyl-3-methyl-5-hydroxy-6-metoxy-1,4-benzoquinol methylase